MKPQETVSIVSGYHGTSSELADVIERDGFRPSMNPYDWLGDGVYFFQEAPGQAWEWARNRYGNKAAVIGAEIQLTHCMDLLDVGWEAILSETYDSYLNLLRQTGRPRPIQAGGAHSLDRAVINYTVRVLGDSGILIDCVRSAFREGRPVYPDSALYSRSHIQIAVRNPETCIRQVWREPQSSQGRL